MKLIDEVLSKDNLNQAYLQVMNILMLGNRQFNA